jgi:hypothetical protein
VQFRHQLIEREIGILGGGDRDNAQRKRQSGVMLDQGPG